MSKVTYLFGAGASANSVPVVNMFNIRIKDTADFLKEYHPEKFNEEALKSGRSVRIDLTETLDILISELQWLYNESEDHLTIDTLAKKFYHTNPRNLKRLKRALISFFIIDQTCNQRAIKITEDGKNYRIKEKIDKRYDALIASLLKDTDSIELADSVKVLSWNYDVQFELALKKYVDENVIDLQRKYQIYPNPDMLNCQNIDFFNVGKFSLVKLNGNAIFEKLAYDETSESPYDHKAKLTASKINNFLEYYNVLFPNNKLKDADPLKYFNYSWETSARFQDKYLGYYCNQEIALSIARQTDVLVIVGYSFPFFNRVLDSALLNAMKLKSLIIQDYSAEEIKNRLIAEVPGIRNFVASNPNKVLLTQPSKYFPTPSDLEIDNKINIPGLSLFNLHSSTSVRRNS